MKFLILIIFLAGCSFTPQKISDQDLTEEVLCTLNEFSEKKCIPIQADDSRVREEKKHGNLEGKLVGKNSYGFIDLNGDGAEELLVYRNKEPGYCGSGGCNLIIYFKNGNKYKKFHEFSVVKMPIIVSDTKTNGYRDLIFMQWRYDKFSFYHVARFKEGKYPYNPTILPFLIDGYVISGDWLFSRL